jgi:hypothetical protein
MLHGCCILDAAVAQAGQLTKPKKIFCCFRK